MYSQSTSNKNTSSSPYTQENQPYNASYDVNERNRQNEKSYATSSSENREYDTSYSRNGPVNDNDYVATGTTNNQRSFANAPSFYEDAIPATRNEPYSNFQPREFHPQQFRSAQQGRQPGPQYYYTEAQRYDGSQHQANSQRDYNGDKRGGLLGGLRSDREGGLGLLGGRRQRRRERRQAGPLRMLLARSGR